MKNTGPRLAEMRAGASGLGESMAVAGAWYHVMNRGHRGEALYLGDADRHRFMGAVAELPVRYGLEVHAFVLMDNHYHLVVRTSEPNLSHAIRWLKVSYAVKFNGAYRSHETVFEWRFKSVLIQEEGNAVEVVREMGIRSQAAAQAVKRFGQALADDPKRERFVAALRRQM